jgi:hypothetical protein
MTARILRYEREVCEGNYETSSVQALDDVARRFADQYAMDSPRFDRARFLAACGVPS